MERISVDLIKITLNSKIKNNDRNMKVMSRANDALSPDKYITIK